MFQCQPMGPLMEIGEMAPPNCPRCASSDTKFCYYNNYSLSQPRYLCKACRRYWTKGGSLRNIPVGGGCRKNRRSKSAKQLISRSATQSPDSNDQQHCSDSSARSGSDIDMAVVFANFLNQKPDADAVAEPDGVTRERVSGLAQGSAVPCRDDENGEFGMESLLGDDVEIGEGLCWSTEASESARFSWQEMAELQDIGGSVPSLMNDNIWSSFDFSGFEIFSRS